MESLSGKLFNPNDKAPLYHQIADSISKQIEKGILVKDASLPSINEFSKTHVVARDTVEKAYKTLKQKGYIISVGGKGYYVIGKPEKRIKILLVFNKLSSYKKNVYYSFIKTLGKQAKVDLQIHHYNHLLLKEILEATMGKYHYYVIMPHFSIGADKNDYLNVLKMIPEKQLVLLDKSVPELSQCLSVCQDFRNDIYQALVSAGNKLEKYQRIAIVFPDFTDHPREIIEGIQQFCQEHKKQFQVISDADTIELKKGTVYISLYENDLAVLIKKIRICHLKIGQEIGVISFNETVFKELLDITVISTDFDQMGKTAAKLILKNEYRQLRNPFKLIQRGSL